MDSDSSFFELIETDRSFYAAVGRQPEVRGDIIDLRLRRSTFTQEVF